MFGHCSTSLRSSRRSITSTRHCSYCDIMGLPVLAYKRNKPKNKGGYRRSNEICTMAACRRLIHRLAPRDVQMYERYKRKFEARLQRLGHSFASRVALLQEAVASVQPLWARTPRRQTVCKFQLSPPAKGAALPGLRCPFGLDEGRMSACARVYAQRSFECPWQYERNSSLTDAVGCWRPSSGRA